MTDDALRIAHGEAATAREAACNAQEAAEAALKRSLDAEAAAVASAAAAQAPAAPKDVSGDVLAQLGSRIQHQLRAFTPDDTKSLRATVSTYPKSQYDLADILQNLPTGEVLVLVMHERGAPSPVAWTRLRALQG